MIGYHRDQAATAAVIDPSGWLHTGDLAMMDERGYLRIAGRLRDMIIRGGENVYPRAVEDVLSMHPAVADVAVLGLPDAEWGESVAAFVRPRDAVTGPALEDHCRAHLASYKVPRTWRFVEEMPMTPSGKVRKIELREQLECEVVDGDQDR